MVSRRLCQAFGGMLLVLSIPPSEADAGAWTTEEGHVWVKLALFHLDADRIFVDALRADSGEMCGGVDLELGQRAPFDCVLEGGGGLRTTQLFMEAAIGVHERVDVRVQLPLVLHAEFRSEGTPQSRSGLGDVRIGSQLRILDDPVVWAAQLEVKAPTGFFTRDAVGVPLGEGQWDITARTLISRSLWGGPVWVGAELGYRLRLPNPELGIAGLNVGDELLAVGEMGLRPVAWAYLPARLELLWGLPSSEQQEGLPDRPGRRVLYLQSGVLLNPWAGARGEHRDLGFEVGVRYPVYGEGWPADPVWFTALSGRFSAFDL